VQSGLQLEVIHDIGVIRDHGPGVAQTAQVPASTSESIHICQRLRQLRSRARNTAPKTSTVKAAV
jgi:hypothetical protein